MHSEVCVKWGAGPGKNRSRKESQELICTESFRFPTSPVLGDREPDSGQVTSGLDPLAKKLEDVRFTGVGTPEPERKGALG